MTTIWRGRLVGTFYGYKGGRVYELDDGTTWRQDDRTDEPVYRLFPTARLIRNASSGTVYLDVDGTSASVVVSPAVSGLPTHAPAPESTS